jgi:hypothetical protein
MGDQARQQQQPVFYDTETGQYYTQTPTNNSPFSGVFNNNQLSAMNGGYGQQNSWLSSLFGKGGQRTYINGLGNQSMIRTPAPYEYADVSLESLFPQLATNGSQQGSLSGLLGSSLDGATSQASSGAGRFL